MAVFALIANRSGQFSLDHLWLGGGEAAKKPLKPLQDVNGPGVPNTTPADFSGGPVGEPLPWTGNPQVETLKQKYHTPVLVAAYKARLAEPIMAEAHNISHAADLLAGTVVPPGDVFSQNSRIGPYTGERGFKVGPMYVGNRIVPAMGGGVCKISSLLYNVVILSDLQVVERHPHSMTVPYVPAGQDATVAYGTCDFRFQNTSGAPILIWADMVDDTLYIAFYGQKKPPLVTWRHETLSRSRFRTEMIFNPSLPPGTEKEIIPGQEGVVVRSWLTIETEDGKVTRRDLGTNRYQACPRVVEYNRVQGR
jgi:vancomycin resistance protein YoaR